MAFDFSQITGVASGLWESLSEGATQYVDAIVKAKVTDVSEAKADVDNLKVAEPEKGQRADGSTIVVPASSGAFMGFDRNTLLLGAAFTLGVILVAKRL